MNYFAKIKQNWLMILLVSVTTLAIAVIFTFIQPFEYRSSFSLLVIEKDPNLDAFSAAKSAERLSVSLGQIIYTTSFYDKVVNSGYLNSNIKFPQDEIKRRDLWKRQIETRVSPDIGVIKMAVYNQNRDQAENLANAIAMVLSEKGTEYLGGGNSINLKIVDYPTTSNQPVRPNIALNLAAGILLGLGGSIGYSVLQAMRSKNQEAVPLTTPNQPMPLASEMPSAQPLPVENNFMFQEYVPKSQPLEPINDIMPEATPTPRPILQKEAAEEPGDPRIRTIHDHLKVKSEAIPGRPFWNGPEEEFQNFE